MKRFSQISRLIFWPVLLWTLFALALSGFDMVRHAVPLTAIVDGGPGKDGIPALTNPRMIPPARANAMFMQPGDRVLGVALGGQARAYPVKILNWHEIVNDRVGGRSIVVTYCPLCGTGMVFDAQVGGRRHTFGVSGLLYQSDMLMYDRETESLWSQIMRQAVTGKMMGARLTLLASTATTWEHWTRLHPETRVLSVNTGYTRDYNRNPYGDYGTRRDILFEVQEVDGRYHPKEWVAGVEVAGKFKAYPVSELAKGDSPVEDRFSGKRLKIVYNANARSVSVFDDTGREVPSVPAYWFAWYAYHSETQVFERKPQ